MNVGNSAPGFGKDRGIVALHPAVTDDVVDALDAGGEAPDQKSRDERHDQSEPPP
jgi:hypothetical protein